MPGYPRNPGEKRNASSATNPGFLDVPRSPGEFRSFDESWNRFEEPTFGALRLAELGERWCRQSFHRPDVRSSGRKLVAQKKRDKKHRPVLQEASLVLFLDLVSYTIFVVQRSESSGAKRPIILRFRTARLKVVHFSKPFMRPVLTLILALERICRKAHGPSTVLRVRSANPSILIGSAVCPSRYDRQV